ncbi:hypothetical protein FPHYL_7756 [Fusarium phyllophilum]|uniref:Uncharacterized protein n=1 Tax=Fusarium phyllophilum TaxID=47803 RepID=A0A8H5N919_9HYPO|nr:hypothetical protein FPHYL_7756 [Fusarium phyllophilum]
MCQKSSYEKRCEECNSRVIIHVVSHHVCGGKPPVSMTKAEKADRKTKGHEIPYRMGDFICQRRIRPHKKYWSYVGSHACWHCSLRKHKNEAEEELKTLLANKSRTETEKSLEYLSKRSLEVDEELDGKTASTDSPATSDGEPSSIPAINKGKGKAVATMEVEDVPSEATRSSPFPGGTVTQDTASDVEMEDRESVEAEDKQRDFQVLAARALTVSALTQFWGWSDRR